MQSEKEKVALTSIAVSAGLTVAKAVVGLLSGSLALLSEAAHSLIDLLATVMTYFAVRISGKPADEEHHYGHGKVESVTALAETALLFVLSGVVIWEAAHRLFGGHGHAVEATLWAFARDRRLDRGRFLPRAAALPRGARNRERSAGGRRAAFRLRHVVVDRGADRARRRRGSAIQWADAAAALVVAVFVCLAGWRLGRRTIDTLTDTAPRGLGRHDHAAPPRACAAWSRSSACGCGRSATSCSSSSCVAVSRTLPLDRVEAAQARRSPMRFAPPCPAPRSASPPRRARSTTSPCIERVMVIARNQALAVHHVTVHDIRGKLSVSLDLEVDRKLPLGGAHDIADRLEAALREELGTDVEVETHIEPLQAGRRGARSARPSASGRCSRRWPRSPPRAAWSATFTTCGCARPTKARSSISIAGSTRR